MSRKAQLSNKTTPAIHVRNKTHIRISWLLIRWKFIFLSLLKVIKNLHQSETKTNPTAVPKIFAIKSFQLNELFFCIPSRISFINPKDMEK